MISLRLPEETNEKLEKVAEESDRSKSYLIKKAIEEFLSEYEDLRIARSRLDDVDDKMISSKEMRKKLGL